MTAAATTLPFPTPLPDGWRVGTVDDCCLRLVDGDWIETKDQGGSDYRLLQVSNIGVGTFRETGKFRFITQSTFDRLRCTEIEVGDILVSRMPDPLGRAWWVTPLPWRIVTAVDVAILTPHPEVVEGRYLADYLNSPFNLGHALVRATGTTRARITRRDLATFPIPLPPLPTQRKIASVLSAYDDLIANNLRRIEILEAMAQAIYREWFVEFGFPGHEDVAMVESELGPIPDGWEVKPFGDIIKLAYGKGLRAGDRRGGSVAVYGSGGVVGYHDEPLVEGPGIVVGRKGNVGSVYWSDGDFYPIDTTYYVETTYPLTFVFYVLDEQEFIDSHAAVPGLSRDQAYRIPLVVPPADIARAFDVAATDLYRLRANLRRRANVLRQARDLLLPKLVAGEIDVSDLDIDTGDLAA